MNLRITQGCALAILKFIRYNKISGEFDYTQLALVMEDILKDGIDLDLTGFEPLEVDKLFQELQREQGVILEDDFDADAEIAAIGEPITQRGDIWLLGKHRLMCGDSTDLSDVVKLMGGTKARMVFTDPPWNAAYS